MKKIKLKIRVNETCNNISYGITKGWFIKEIENKDNFIKPILETCLMLGYYKFQINRIYQDTLNSQLILQENYILSQYTFQRELKPLEAKLLPNGWKWIEEGDKE